MRTFPAALLLIAFATAPLDARSAGTMGVMLAAPQRAAHGGGSVGGPHRGRPIWRNHRRHHGSRDAWNGYGFAFGYGGYADVYDAPFGGFFADGEALRVGRQVLYDYDRGYPYEYYRGSGPVDLAYAAPPPHHPARCDIELGVRVCRR